jgi:hypothetical protein
MVVTDPFAMVLQQRRVTLTAAFKLSSRSADIPSRIA